jgi:hypothetical protein
MQTSTMSISVRIRVYFLSVLVAVAVTANAQEGVEHTPSPLSSSGVEGEALARRAATMLASGRITEARALALSAIA